MSIIKNKTIVALITTINSAFVYMLFNFDGSATEIVPYLSDIILFTFFIALIYVAPIAFICGIPISIAIDKLTVFINNLYIRISLQLALYFLSGICILLFFSLLSGTMPIISDENDIINLIIISIYPTTFFGIIDITLRR